MEDLVRYRAMESLCRQSAVFRPLESWRVLAEAEMSHHKALAEIPNRSIECNEAPPAGALAHTAVLCNPRDRSRLLPACAIAPRPRASPPGPSPNQRKARLPPRKSI